MNKITTLIIVLFFSSFLLVGTAIATTMITPGSGTPLTGAGGILDQVYGLGNLQRVDDTIDKIFAPANGSVTAIAKFSDRNQTLGFIPRGSDGFFNDPFLPLFTVPGGTNGIGLGGPTAAFNLGVAPGGNPTWTSLDSQNSDGQDHMVTWDVVNKTNTWVIAWEETNGGVGDFTDLVAEISYSQGLDTNNVDFLLTVRSNPVPEPCTMLLFGAGLAGIVGARFRRKKE